MPSSQWLMLSVWRKTSPRSLNTVSSSSYIFLPLRTYNGGKGSSAHMENGWIRMMMAGEEAANMKHNWTVVIALERR